MKTLEEFELVKEFLGGQGIQPTAAMICASGPEWQDLVVLAREWRNARDEEIRRKEEELAGLSEEELAQRDREALEAARKADEKLLYHSAGYRPE
jgi:arsenate reductase-like glutaredoxin family protein